MNALDRDSVKMLHDAVQAAVREVFERTGFEMAKSRCSFDPSSGAVSFKIEASKLGVGGENETARIEWGRYASMLRLPLGILGKSFRAMGQTFTVVGLNMRARKRPVQCVDERGRRYVFTAEQVRLNFPDVTL